MKKAVLFAGGAVFLMLEGGILAGDSAAYAAKSRWRHISEKSEPEERPREQEAAARPKKKKFEYTHISSEDIRAAKEKARRAKEEKEAEAKKEDSEWVTVGGETFRINREKDGERTRAEKNPKEQRVIAGFLGFTSEQERENHEKTIQKWINLMDFRTKKIREEARRERARLEGTRAGYVPQKATELVVARRDCCHCKSGGRVFYIVRELLSQHEAEMKKMCPKSPDKLPTLGGGYTRFVPKGFQTPHEGKYCKGRNLCEAWWEHCYTEHCSKPVLAQVDMSRCEQGDKGACSRTMGRSPRRQYNERRTTGRR